MTDILDVIKGRQSIRKYLATPLPESVIDRLLEAARWAPSGENHQPWNLVVIRDPETRKRIGSMCSIHLGAFATVEYCMGRMSQLSIQDHSAREKVASLLYTGKLATFIGEAPLLIAVVGACNALDMPYDLSACTENMLLEAHSLGLGACWMNGPIASPRTECRMKELLDIPFSMAEYKLLTIVSFGYPEGKRRYPRPRKAIEEFVFWEKFGQKTRPERAK